MLPRCKVGRDILVIFDLILTTLEARAIDPALVNQILEVQIVEGVDAPHVNHLIPQCELIVRVCLLHAAVDVLGVDLEQKLQVAEDFLGTHAGKWHR